MLDYEELANVFWDVIVIGTGMGGATTGYELARKGKRVLFLERGYFLAHSKLAATEFCSNSNEGLDHSRMSQGLWPRMTKGFGSFVKKGFFLSVGCGAGGSSILYAAQLERMMDIDFRPKANYPNITDSSLPEEWPVKYVDFVPYYDMAEKLYKITGTQDPLNSHLSVNIIPPPPLTNSNKRLFKDLVELGCSPYRSHVACAFIKGCDGCTGIACKHNCKNDAAKICIVPALENYDAKLVTNCEVVRLHSSMQEITGVECKIGDIQITFRGKIIILAAGALSTPEILLKSVSESWPNGLANSSGYVGRNLMWHVSDIFAIKPKRPNGSYESKRQISFNDFYYVNGRKLGNVQEMGFNWFTKERIFEILNNRVSRLGLRFFFSKHLLKAIALIAHYRFHGSSMYASVVEDLPYLRNRVFLQNGELVYEYHYSSDLKNRSKLLLTLLSKKIKTKYRVIKLSSKNNINYGHACGTCRFGDDPKTSVINCNNRSHDINNLFITDSSFFPSSGGVNPSLTIAANALRVADFINNNWVE